MHERTTSRDEPRRERGEPEGPRVPAPAEALLQLQRHAGNRAVAGMLARDPVPATRQATSVTMGMGDLGVIPLDSFHLEQARKEMQVSFGWSPIVPRFMNAAGRGEPFALVWISSPAMRTEMTAVYIGTVTTSGGEDPEDQIVSATLSFESIETKPA